MAHTEANNRNKSVLSLCEVKQLFPSANKKKMDAWLINNVAHTSIQTQTLNHKQNLSFEFLKFNAS